MKEVLQKKTLFVVIPLLIALLSVFVLSGPASSPDLHGSTLAALEEKQTTVPVSYTHLTLPTTERV